ncbi:hypothetical protein MMPV_004615 [Pyropia vietnamensis]
MPSPAAFLPVPPRAPAAGATAAGTQVHRRACRLRPRVSVVATSQSAGADAVRPAPGVWPPRGAAAAAVSAALPTSTPVATATVSATAATASSTAATSAVPAAPTTAPSVATDPAAPPLRTYDVTVIGGGPAGLSLAAALGATGLSVVALDPAIDVPWPNHYGVWADEFEPLGLGDCATSTYPTTTIYVPSDADGVAEAAPIVLDRSYLRVDRVKLKARLLERCAAGGVVIERANVTAVDHSSDTHSTVTFVEGRPRTSTMRDNDSDPPPTPPPAPAPRQLRTRLVVDATGHALRFVQTAPGYSPGFQAAYGIEAVVEGHPFPHDEMLLMDFRDDHMQGDATDAAASSAAPTFLYVFPTDSNRVFLEETSIILPEAMPFETLRERLNKRLAHLGVTVKSVVEEEYSLIPLGGSVPLLGQRVVGFGGSACLVHPATGYMVARTLSLAESLAGEIATALRTPAAGASRWGRGANTPAAADVSPLPLAPADAVAAAAWAHLWSESRIRERDFLLFGADLLAGLDLRAMKEFFAAFFRLPQPLWAGFLSFRLERPSERATFAFVFFLQASNRIRGGLLRGIVTTGRWKLIRSVLPLWLARLGDSSHEQREEDQS